MYRPDHFASAAAASLPWQDPASILPVDLFVARMHRGAVAPHGFRFVANIDAADLGLARFALKYGSTAGELQLVMAAVDNAGGPVAGAALYVREHLPEPDSFWSMFHSLGRLKAA